MCKLHCSLYGLKQSLRAWFDRFSSVVQEFGMLRSTTDHAIFYHHNSSRQCIYLVVYVDDIVTRIWHASQYSRPFNFLIIITLPGSVFIWLFMWTTSSLQAVIRMVFRN